MTSDPSATGTVDDPQRDERRVLVADWTERAARISALVGRTIPVTTVPISTVTHR